MAGPVVAETGMSAQVSALVRYTGRLEEYCSDLARCIKQLYETGAIQSEETKSALEEDNVAIRALAQSIGNSLGNINGHTNGHINTMRTLDSFEESYGSGGGGGGRGW